MVHYKLTYFDARGAAEHIRQLFALAEQEFEDDRIPFDEWSKRKENMPFGQIPVLEEDGKQLAQSYAIARYLARQFGFAGKTFWEEAQVDALVDQWKDFTTEIRTYTRVLNGRLEGDLEKLREELFLPAVKKHFPFFVYALQKTSSGFLVDPSVTFVDIMVAEFIANLNQSMPDLVSQYPELRDHMEKIHAIPQIKKWRETRPETRM